MVSEEREPERFVFGIPLISRATAGDWARVDALLGLTLRSLLAQTDRAFEVLLAGHDQPPAWQALVGRDPRFRFMQAEWNPETPTLRNDDSGMKKWRIKDAVRASGGGLLMYLDADDLVDRGLVAAARAGIGSDTVGGVVLHGLMLDCASLRAVWLPDARVYDGPFHELCGSSTIGRIDPDSPDPLRRDPHEGLGSHHRWPESAAAAGVALARLPVCGAYLVNTSQNHSEWHGPHAEWRRGVNAAVARVGIPFGGALARRFGLEAEHLAALVPACDPGALPGEAAARRARR